MPAGFNAGGQAARAAISSFTRLSNALVAATVNCRSVLIEPIVGALLPSAPKTADPTRIAFGEFGFVEVVVVCTVLDVYGAPGFAVAPAVGLGAGTGVGKVVVVCV